MSPSTEGPTIQPAAISPATPGSGGRVVISAPVCAATQMMKRLSGMSLA